MGRDGYVCALATRKTAGSAAAPAARCRNRLRGSFILVPIDDRTMRDARAAHREHLWECRSRQKKVAIGQGCNACRRHVGCRSNKARSSACPRVAAALDKIHRSMWSRKGRETDDQPDSRIVNCVIHGQYDRSTHAPAHRQSSRRTRQDFAALDPLTRQKAFLFDRGACALSQF